MAKGRMITEDILYDDIFLTLSLQTFKLYVYLLAETDSDGIVTGINRIINTTKSEKENLQELIDNNFIIQEPNTEQNKSKYAITHFHVMNRMETNSSSNSNKYKPTQYLSFKNKLFVTLDSTLTLDESEGFYPYSLYRGGSMAKVLENYEAQKELDNLQKKEPSQDGDLDKIIREKNPQYYKNK